MYIQLYRYCTLLYVEFLYRITYTRPVFPINSCAAVAAAHLVCWVLPATLLCTAASCKKKVLLLPHALTYSLTYYSQTRSILQQAVK
jgi:hypothetical protein